MPDLDLNRITKHLLGRTWDEITQIPSIDGLIDAALKEDWSRFPVRNIGTCIEDGSPLLFTEEDLESHIHILGSPGEGKSKLIELQALQSLNRGYPVCVLDPSAHGATVYKILKQCINAGFKKILFIDPADFLTFGKVPVINPFGPPHKTDPTRYRYPMPLVRRHIADIVRVLWGQQWDKTPRITKYVNEVVTALFYAHGTLVDFRHFFDRHDRQYQAVRGEILDCLPEELRGIGLSLTQVFATRWDWTEFESTVRRIGPIIETPCDLMVGSVKESVSFTKLVAEGWLILVNLVEDTWGEEQQRFVGTLIINELIRAVNILTERKAWNGRMYFYIDEAGDYATQKLARILAHKRKSGFRFALAHQYYGQFKDPSVREAVQALTKIKILFHSSYRDDRDRMIRDMYGGDIPDRQVSYVLGELQKQHASIKVNKQHPKIVRLRDLPDVQVPPEAVELFKKELYKQPWYHAPAEIRREINDRFTQGPIYGASQSTTKQSSRSKAQSSKRPHKTRPVEAAGEQLDSGQDSRSSGSRGVPDNPPGRPPLLRRPTGRPTRPEGQD